MAIVTRKMSDLTGAEGSDEEFATVIVRSHPSIDQAKQLDVMPEEIKDLKDASADLVQLEIKQPNGTEKTIFVKLSEFNKLNPEMDKILKEARGTRGRQPGFRPGG